MTAALPPLRPRFKRPFSESSIDPNLSRTCTLINQKTRGEGQVYLSKSESISPECARVNIAPFAPGSYLHRYDSRFVTIQKGNTRYEQLDQVQNIYNKENNTQIAFINSNNFQESAAQQQSSSLKNEVFFGPTASSTKNETKTNENPLFETRNKSLRRSFASTRKENHFEGDVQLINGFPLRRCARSLSFRCPNRAMKRRKSRKQEQLMVRNYPVNPSFESWSTLNNQQQLISVVPNMRPNPLNWFDSNLDPELSALSHQFERVVRISSEINH